MTNSVLSFIKLIISFLPFVLFAFLNSKANVKKEVRNRQYIMPVVAVVYSIILLIFLDTLADLCLKLFLLIARLFDKVSLPSVGKFIRGIYKTWGIYLVMILFNVLALVVYVILKRIITLAIKNKKVYPDTFIGNVVGIFYYYDETDECWYIKEHLGQARTFIKTAYYGSCFVSGLAMLISCSLCLDKAVSAPFYPVFAVIIIGELAFFIDGLKSDEKDSSLSVFADRSKRIAMYPLLRKPLKALFGDKLSAEGTTINEGGIKGGAVEEILANLEKNGGHVGKNYVAFLRKKIVEGLKPNVNYIRCGYDLATGKSLLFNTPFYDKLNPYAFYAMNRHLLTGGKVLVVLGRHGTEEDLHQWCANGMLQLSNVPDLWKIEVLSGAKKEEDDLPDIGIISRSGVHNLDIHRANLAFLREVSFVVVVEPSRLITTAQIGLNLLIKCCGEGKDITFCSVDRNCDGLLDALSHILMTNITEVAATEYPQGLNSYMYWTADGDYLQHRILPGISRFLGIGTELSMVALKNQVKETVWYGGEAFPVRDAHWIAKQYYHDLLEYAQLPTNQETFDNCFKASFNMCNEKVKDYSFVTVEDDRNNLFEIRRNFATMAEKQGFVNVISSEYMLREYMSNNTKLFTADAKAIPYITADFARTKRNTVLSLCLLLCIDFVKKETLQRQMIMMNVDTEDPITEIWKEIIEIFTSDEQSEVDKEGNKILVVKGSGSKTLRFKKDTTILFKRMYSVESGKFEDVYTIEDSDFANIILNDLQNASYIAECESKDDYIGTELKGHIYQKYLPGQFFTLNGKYYEMVSTAVGNRIMVRRASDHIGGRLSYRQVRNYRINQIENAQSMGALKTVNNIDIHYQFADFSVETPGYWSLGAYNDFESGSLVEINGIPVREYYHKQILKFDFSKWGDAFTDSIRVTLTNLLNEVFVTLFADNQPYISAVTPGQYEAPMTYSLEVAENVSASDKCIYIVEDSQLDIGLLVAVERNVNRIFQIISDYLAWNEEQIEKSQNVKTESAEEKAEEVLNEKESEEDAEKPAEKKSIFGRIGDWFKGLFKKKSSEEDSEVAEENADPTEEVAEIEPAEEVSEETAEAEEVAEETVEEKTEEAEVDEEVESSEEVLEAEPEVAEVTEEVSEEESVEEPIEEPIEETPEEAPAEETPAEETPAEELKEEPTEEVTEPVEKKSIFSRIGSWFKGLFKKKKDDKPAPTEDVEEPTYTLTDTDEPEEVESEQVEEEESKEVESESIEAEQVEAEPDESQGGEEVLDNE